MAALYDSGDLDPEPATVNEAVSGWYRAALSWFGGGATSNAEVDEALSKVWKWGTALRPDEESWGMHAAEQGGMSAIVDLLADDGTTDG